MRRDEDLRFFCSFLRSFVRSFVRLFVRSLFPPVPLPQSVRSFVRGTLLPVRSFVRSPVPPTSSDILVSQQTLPVDSRQTPYYLVPEYRWGLQELQNYCSPFVLWFIDVFVQFSCTFLVFKSLLFAFRPNQQKQIAIRISVYVFLNRAKPCPLTSDTTKVPPSPLGGLTQFIFDSFLLWFSFGKNDDKNHRGGIGVAQSIYIEGKHLILVSTRILSDLILSNFIISYIISILILLKILIFVLF